MAYSAAALITDAYYLSGLVARNFEVVSAEQMSDGLSLLNFVLGDKNMDSAAIPFYQKYTTASEIGVEIIYVPNLIIDSTLTFNIGSTRYPTQRVSREAYFGSGRTEYDSLIFSWHPERLLNGTNIYLYPFPDQIYPVEIFGKFALTQLSSPDTDLTLSYEMAYINYLKYKLSQRICDENTISIPENVSRQLKIIEADLSSMNPMDFTQKYVSTLERYDDKPVWAIVNLDGYWGVNG